MKSYLVKVECLLSFALCLALMIAGVEVQGAKSHQAASATPKPKSAVEELTSSSPEALAKDFAVACEMSKLSINLGKNQAFKDDPADLAYRVSEMMSGAFKTAEVKDAYREITAAAPENRVELWHRSAKELGVKNFKCKTIGFK